MLDKILPVLPISDLRTRAKEILASVKIQPIIITQRGRANAVLLSYELYNEIIARLERLEDLRDAMLLRRAQETSEGVVPAEALKAQYGELFHEPFDAAKPLVAPTKAEPQPFLAAKEVGVKYQTRRRGKKGRSVSAKRRANV